MLPPLKGSTAAVACGWLHTLALEYGGNVQAWGANQVGCLTRWRSRWLGGLMGAS